MVIVASRSLAALAKKTSSSVVQQLESKQQSYGWVLWAETESQTERATPEGHMFVHGIAV